MQTAVPVTPSTPMRSHGGAEPPLITFFIRVLRRDGGEVEVAVEVQVAVAVAVEVEVEGEVQVAVEVEVEVVVDVEVAVAAEAQVAVVVLAAHRTDCTKVLREHDAGGIVSGVDRRLAHARAYLRREADEDGDAADAEPHVPVVDGGAGGGRCACEAPRCPRRFLRAHGLRRSLRAKCFMIATKTMPVRAWGGRRRIARRAARAELGARAEHCARRTAAAEQHPDRRVDVQQPEDHQAGGEQVEERRDAEQHVRARRHLVLLRELRRRRRVGLRLLVAVPLREVVRRQRERHAEEHEPRLEERGLNVSILPVRPRQAIEGVGEGRGRRGGRADLRAHLEERLRADRAARAGR